MLAVRAGLLRRFGCLINLVTQFFRFGLRFQLFGSVADPGYVDVAPKDGVDDRRAARLLELAERFSPILRRNTYSVPEAFEATLGGRVVLHVDSWLDGKRIAVDSVDLGPPLPAPT